MSYKTERIKDIYLYFHEYGLEATAKHFDIKQESVSRYCRMYKFKKKNQRAPQILLLDIETLPMHFRAWRPGKQYLRVDQMVDGKDWVVLSWSAKWLCAPDIVSDILIPSEAIERDDGPAGPGVVTTTVLVVSLTVTVVMALCILAKRT